MIFRELRPDETKMLQEFLYEAIFVPAGQTAPPKEIIRKPELALYYEGFGDGEADTCIVAETDGRVIGAVWARIMQDYGHVDDETPSLAIALYPEYRGQGTGRALLERILSRLQKAGYRRISLSVQKANPAARLYARAGFTILRETDEEWIMIREL